MFRQKHNCGRRLSVTFLALPCLNAVCRLKSHEAAFKPSAYLFGGVTINYGVRRSEYFKKGDGRGGKRTDRVVVGW